MIKVLITGGTGLIGKQLTQLLQDKGYKVAILSRNPKSENQYKWDVAENYIDDNAFKNVTHIIHLAGAGIADKRWTKTRKKELVDSRVKTANLVFKKVKELNIKLQKFITASGIGYYGARTSEEIFTENTQPYNDFISTICVRWENAVQQFTMLNIPVTILRTGIVLSKKDGALQKMNTPLFLSVLGSGNQYMPWIHIYDLCQLYIKAVEDSSFNGIYNAVAPEHQTNKLFTQTLGKIVGKTVLPISVPDSVLKMVLGEMAHILLKGSRISAEKITKNYHFEFTNLTSALQDILT